MGLYGAGQRTRRPNRRSALTLASPGWFPGHTGGVFRAGWCRWFLILCGFQFGLTAASGAALRPWTDYRVIMWVGDSVWKQPEKVPLFVERLREMGVDTAMVHGVGADPRPWLATGFPFYVENIVNRGLCLKWNSPLADCDRFVTDWAQTG